MSRSAEFGLGATFLQKDADGNESEHNAILAVGGKRDGNQARMLPPLEAPPQWDPEDGPMQDGWTNQGLGLGHDTTQWQSSDEEYRSVTGR